MLLGSLAIHAQYLTELQFELSRALHYLEATLNPELTVNALKLRGLRTEADMYNMSVVFTVADMRTKKFLGKTSISEDILGPYANSQDASVLKEFSEMKFISFEVLRDGKKEHRYPIPMLRTDTASKDWSSKLVNESTRVFADVHSWEVH
ncbi:MAG: hypothetical protein AB8F78_19475 [Saprospiraceae bacterium]